MGNLPNFGKEVNRVYQTKEYSKFKFRNDNRIVNQNHVKSITRKMKEKGWYPGSYVIVNSKFEIIDGQHRVKAAMEANVPIQYTMEKGAGFQTIRNLNTNQKNWALADHIHGFVEEKNENYIRLNDFMNEFPELKPTECMMLTQNCFTHVDRDVFESGNFTTKDMDVARDWARNIMLLKPYFEGYNRSMFIRALVKILSKRVDFIFDEFVRKVKMRPDLIHFCGSVPEYVGMIEEIYNYRRRNTEKLNLRF
jgi:hypothetical protein